MNSLAVYGTRGTILNGAKSLDPTGDLPSRKVTAEFSSERGHASEMIVMLRHMADCVLNGTKPWVGVREGARVVATGFACWDSLRSGMPEKVRNDF